MDVKGRTIDVQRRGFSNAALLLFPFLKKLINGYFLIRRV